VAPGNPLANAPVKAWDIGLVHERALAWGNITLSVGYSSVDASRTTILEDGARGFVTWSHEIR